MIFAKQRTYTDCGPVALANALKFLGYYGYRGNESFLKMICRYNTNGVRGVYVSNLEKAGRNLATAYGFKFQRMEVPSWRAMRSAMDNGWGLIATFNWRCGEPGGHFVFLCKDGAGYSAANDSLYDAWESGLVHRETPYQIWEARIKRRHFVCFKVRLF